MKSYYFTYGTDPDFPFCGGYTKVTANTMTDAIRLFRGKHPDRHKNTVNCAFMYREDEFVKLFYGKDIQCHEVIEEKVKPITTEEFLNGADGIRDAVDYCNIHAKTHKLITMMAQGEWTQEDCDIAAADTDCFAFSPDDVQYQKCLENSRIYHIMQEDISYALSAMRKIIDIEDRKRYYESHVKPLIDKRKTFTNSVQVAFPERIFYK